MHTAPYASDPAASRGREFPEERAGSRGPRSEFQRDRDRIVHSIAFRRLRSKTQVFIAPDGDHYRTRLTHSLEVAQVGRVIARELGLNEDLTEALCLGHLFAGLQNRTEQVLMVVFTSVSLPIGGMVGIIIERTSAQYYVARC